MFGKQTVSLIVFDRQTFPVWFGYGLRVDLR